MKNLKVIITFVVVAVVVVIGLIVLFKKEQVNYPQLDYVVDEPVETIEYYPSNGGEK